MKPVFKCDYCSFMGTEEEVKEHEVICTENYDRRNCHTCKYKKYKTAMSYECVNGIAIPEGKFFELCDTYERRQKSDNPWSDIMDAMFRR